VNAVLTKPLIEALRFCQSRFSDDIVKAYSPFVRSLLSLGIERKTILSGNIDKILKTARNNDKVRRNCTKIAYEYIISAHSERYRIGTIDKEVFGVMRSTRSFYAGLDNYVKLRKDFWSNHYWEQSEKCRKEYLLKKSQYVFMKYEQIKYQVAAKMFRHIRIVNSRRNEQRFEVKFDRTGINETLMTAAERYVKRLREFKSLRAKLLINKRFTNRELEILCETKHIPGPEGCTHTVYAKKLDKLIRWHQYGEHNRFY